MALSCGPTNGVNDYLDAINIGVSLTGPITNV